VGVDLHRRRSVLVGMTPEGELLAWIRGLTLASICLIDGDEFHLGEDMTVPLAC
jgi:hypothetical protein